MNMGFPFGREIFLYSFLELCFLENNFFINSTSWRKKTKTEVFWIISKPRNTLI